jgi:TBC domain-containing protein kinase-like protein
MRLDKESVSRIDHQLGTFTLLFFYEKCKNTLIFTPALDIPRCHQYNDLLASELGREKMMRILKAWIFCNTDKYVYWQGFNALLFPYFYLCAELSLFSAGLDSLLAPFLCIFFNEEHIAYASFSNFVEKYLPDIFVLDNSEAIKRRMASFQQIISLLDAELAAHFISIGLTPDLFAISWYHIFFLLL